MKQQQGGARGGRPPLGPGGMPDLSKLSAGQMAQMQVRCRRSYWWLRRPADLSLLLPPFLTSFAFPTRSSPLVNLLTHRIAIALSPSSRTLPTRLRQPLLATLPPFSLTAGGSPLIEHASSRNARADVAAGSDGADAGDDEEHGRRRRVSGDGGWDARHEQVNGDDGSLTTYTEYKGIAVLIQALANALHPPSFSLPPKS